MPLLDSITVLPQDLLNILESLRHAGHNGPVKIIDTNGSITVRDINEMFICDVKREDAPLIGAQDDS